jgi:hypothetical protein
MTVTIAVLDMCPVLSQKFRRFRGLGRVGAQVAFIVCGGMLAGAVGLAIDLSYKPVTLLLSGAAWHLLLMGSSKLRSVIKSFYCTWKRGIESSASDSPDTDSPEH